MQGQQAACAIDYSRVPLSPGAQEISKRQVYEELKKQMLSTQIGYKDSKTAWLKMETQSQQAPVNMIMFNTQNRIGGGGLRASPVPPPSIEINNPG